MKKYNHLEYTKALAIKLKELRHSDTDPHYTRCSSIDKMEEFLALSSALNGFQLIAVDEVVSAFIDNLSDNVLDRQNHTFYIVKNAPVGDIEKQSKAKTDCDKIALKCLSRYFKDCRTDSERTTDLGLRNLEKSRVVRQSIGPIGDNFYGVMVMFTIIEPTGIKFNDEDWDD